MKEFTKRSKIISRDNVKVRAHLHTTVNPVLNGHLKMVLMENGGLMKVESIAECSHWSILQYV